MNIRRIGKSGGVIIARLNGGLGNQFFQYAAGFALAIHNGAELKLDLSVFTNGRSLRQTFRNPDILDFCISAPIATHEEIERIRNPFGIGSKLFRLVQQKGFKRYYPDWHPEIMSQTGDVYLDGYFQCERYFMPCFERLCYEYRLLPEKAEGITLMTKQIDGMLNPVSLHVRRGDYVGHPEHAICTAGYFRTALSAMLDQVGPHGLVVFSDDPQWVRENLELGPDALYVSECTRLDGSRLSPAQELGLMSQCHHHIISNSTFSWWGAYLNRRQDKVVIAPALWNRSKLYQHKNILPSNWIRIPVPN